MPKWPKALWTQLLVSLATSAASAVLAFYWENNHLFAQYAREAPHDGQDGLAAFMGAAGAGLATFCGVFLFSLILQRIMTGSWSFKKN
ncbi:MAG TPA: hypothetical protein VK814_17150 [Acidobacteriaceae bacterium]|jgi:hypothetical protein|nr:hypothetical protein [Acidobacteriaceae bacterium]